MKILQLPQKINPPTLSNFTTCPECSQNSAIILHNSVSYHYQCFECGCTDLCSRGAALGILRSFTYTADIIEEDDFRKDVVNRVNGYKNTTKEDYRTQYYIKKDKLVDSAAINSCGKKIISPVFSGDGVAHVFNSTSEHGNSCCITGVQWCKSVWGCPNCRRKILTQRSKELDEIVEQWKKKYGQVIMLTLTVPHYDNQGLDTVLGNARDKRGILGAWADFIATRGWKSIKEEYGISDYVRALEVTKGGNGWHPHLHVLLFTDKKFVDCEGIEGDILDRWQKSCLKAKLPKPNEHGVKVGIVEQGWYLSKWGMGAELSTAAKEGKKGHYSIAQLEKMLIDRGGDDLSLVQVREYLKEYYRVMRGKKALTFSRGDKLKEIRKDIQLSEEEIVEENPPEKVEIGTLTGNLLYRIYEVKDGMHWFRMWVELAGFKGGKHAIEKLLGFNSIGWVEHGPSG